MKKSLANDKHRTPEQIKEHYEIEKELANKLRNASKHERRYLYTSLYDELFRRVPHHPQLTRKLSPQDTESAVARQLKHIKRFLGKEIVFMEVGPGDCALSFEVARIVRQVYAVDVSGEITRSLIQPPNFQLILSDGQSIPLPPNSVDVAYSNQLMEHLHPDDALEQLMNIYNALVPSGVYVCATPNRLNGPHDVSRYFDKVATGFHLKEYTTFELSSLFRKVGFSRVRAHIGGKGIYLSLPAFPIALFEKSLHKLPYSLRSVVVRIPPSRLLLGIRLVGIK